MPRIHLTFDRSHAPTGLADGREGICTACGEMINRAERSYLNRRVGWFLHKECWRDLNDSQT